RAEPGDHARGDRRDRRGDHVDPRHDDRQRRLGDAGARPARAAVDDPMGRDGLSARARDGDPADRVGRGAVWATARRDGRLWGGAWSAESLIAFRCLQGLAGGMIMPIGMITLAQSAGPKRVGRVMSVVGVPMLLGPALGPFIGGVIVTNLSWRWIFYVNLPI